MDFTLNRTWPTFYDYIPVYKIWIQYTDLFKWYRTETSWSWKRAITPIKIGGFYPKSNLTYILWLYTCVQNLNPIHWFVQMISNGNHFCYLWMGRMDGTEVRTAVILYAPPMKMAEKLCGYLLLFAGKVSCLHCLLKPGVQVLGCMWYHESILMVFYRSSLILTML